LARDRQDLPSLQNWLLANLGLTCNLTLELKNKIGILYFNQVV